MGPSRNLLLLHTRGFQARGDWEDIRGKVLERAPDIDVRVESNETRHDSLLRAWLAARPSLVFSPRPVRILNIPGSAVFQGQSDFGKDRQIARLAAAEIPTPPTYSFPVPPSEVGKLGEFAILKPANRGKGIGVRLVRSASLLAAGVGATAPLLVQPFIDHVQDGRPTEYRVLTLFGRALYCARNQWIDAMRPLADIADSDGVIASNVRTRGGRYRETVNDAEVIALAEKAASAFPDCALLGVDVIRERETGKLYVLEVNPGGRVWHFSSELSQTFDPRHVRDLYAQFGAMDRAADILVGKTRELAR